MKMEIHRSDLLDDRLDMKSAGGIAIINTCNGNTGMHAIFEPG